MTSASTVRTYEIAASRGNKTEVFRKLFVGEVHLFVDALIDDGWSITITEAATGLVISWQEIARRWADLNPADVPWAPSHPEGIRPQRGRPPKQLLRANRSM